MSLLPRPPPHYFPLPLSSAESPAIPFQELHIVQIQDSFLAVVSHRLTCFNTWFPVGGTDLEDCGTSGKWSLAGRSVSLGKGLRIYSPTQLPTC